MGKTICPGFQVVGKNLSYLSDIEADNLLVVMHRTLIR